MLPIPIIGLLLVFHSKTDFNLSAKKVSQYSQASILFSLIVYLFLSTSIDLNSVYNNFRADRLMLFSGNPIPFSFVMLGISVFCLADWRNSNYGNRLIAFLFFLTGIYFAGFLSGTRGTLLAIIIITPILIFYLTSSFIISALIIFISALIGFILLRVVTTFDLDYFYFVKIKNGIETLFLSKNSDESILQRLEMWEAATKAISHEPIFGYGITERFNALKPYLKSFTFEYTHPHNDILAGLIASGLLGSIATISSIISALIAALLAQHKCSDKMLLSLILSVAALITANVSTVFFNDISSAWLAFSVYLIWVTDFKSDQT